jgi:hypothetical protein
MKNMRQQNDNFEEQLLKLVRTLPKVLKFLPSDKAQDARNYVNSLQYWLGGNDGEPPAAAGAAAGAGWLDRRFSGAAALQAGGAVLSAAAVLFSPSTSLPTPLPPPPSYPWPCPLPAPARCPLLQRTLRT